MTTSSPAGHDDPLAGGSTPLMRADYPAPGDLDHATIPISS
ncbi:hypothetical protein [Micromonospora arida]